MGQEVQYMTSSVLTCEGTIVGIASLPFRTKVVEREVPSDLRNLVAEKRRELIGQLVT